MQTPYQEFTRAIIDLFRPISDFFQSLGLPFGPEAWMFILTVSPLLVIIVLLVVRGRRGSGGAKVDEGVRKILASTGDVSGGIAGTKKLKFLKTPAQALVFLKVEENAIQQALSAIDYYNQQGDIDEGIKDKLAAVYQGRLSSVKDALAKDEELKQIVDTSSAVDRARSDYLAKLAAMSGTAVESDMEDAGPSSVGMPEKVSTGPPGGAAPVSAPPSGGPPGGGPPGGGPGGAPPGGIATETPKPAGGKSSLQSEMLAEMERLKALMGGD